MSAFPAPTIDVATVFGFGTEGKAVLKLPSYEEGVDLIGRLANGDVRSLRAYGVNIPKDDPKKILKSQNSEWGLVQMPDKTIWLVRGGIISTEWTQTMAMGAVPLAHSHPNPTFANYALDSEAIAKKGYTSVGGAISAGGTQVCPSLFPSIGDLAVVAKHGTTFATQLGQPYGHEVIVPFVFEKGKIRAAKEYESRPLIRLKIRKANLLSLAGETQPSAVAGSFDVYSGDELIESGIEIGGKFTLPVITRPQTLLNEGYTIPSLSF